MGKIIQLTGTLTGKIEKSIKKNYYIFKKGFDEGKKVQCNKCKEYFDDISNNYNSIVELGICVFCKAEKDIIDNEHREFIGLKMEEQKIKEMRKSELRKKFGNNWEKEQSKKLLIIDNKIKYLTNEHQHIILDSDDLISLLNNNEISESDINAQNNGQINNKISQLIDKGKLRMKIIKTKSDQKIW
jgi:hypothetical protein